MKINKETRIGVAVVVILAMFVWGLNFLKGTSLISVRNQYCAVFGDVSGLQNSTRVTVNGMDMGLITDIHFMDQDINRVLVEVSIKRDFTVPSNSVLEIYNTDFMGGKGVRLIPGDSKVPAAPGDTLRSALEQDVLTALRASILPLAEDVSVLVGSLDSLLGDVRETLSPEMRKDLQGVVSEAHTLIAGERVRISQILSSLESFAGNLQENNQQISRIAGNLAVFSDSLATSDLKPAISGIHQTMEQLQILTRQINKGEGTLGRLAYDPSLYTTLDATLARLDSLLADLKNNPEDYVHLSLFGRKKKEK